MRRRQVRPDAALSPSCHVGAELSNLKTRYKRKAPIVREKRMTAGADGRRQLQGIRGLNAGRGPELGRRA